MKLSNTKSKIIGIQLGEVALNFIKPMEPPIKAKFAFIGDEASILGYTDIHNGWSDKVREAAQRFSEILEEEIFSRVFEEGNSSESPTEESEPPQL